jgi:chromosome segregation protein
MVMLEQQIEQAEQQLQLQQQQHNQLKSEIQQHNNQIQVLQAEQKISINWWQNKVRNNRILYV